MKYASLQNVRYLLFDVHHADELAQYPAFSDFNHETSEMLLQSAKDLADTEFFPFFVTMDQDPARYENGSIYVHPQLKNIIQRTADNGWTAANIPVEHGGMGMSQLLYHATTHFFHAANNGVIGYVTLTTGAAHLITNYASPALIEAYTPNMLNGAWQGTMALTEPHAGSSLSDITTSATPTDQPGVFKINGQKIFISAGDHNATDNVVHLLLARIQGAPAGTKGISLFIVPKYRMTPDGTLTLNDVTTAGNYGKMGQKTYATTHLMFGETGDCEGYLVGEPNKGLGYMFQMMNEARLGVGLAAISTATAAYYASLKYCQERPQGRRLNEKNLTLPPTLIINHPDVRRMLFFQKSVVEGGLSLVLECARLQDLTHVLEGTAQEEANLLLEILIPVCKTFPAEYGAQAINAGLQTLGGAGYCYDFPLQQYYRDIRIMSIYEGTTGIQSLDPLGRKTFMEQGRAIKLYGRTVAQTVAEAEKQAILKPYASLLGAQLHDLQQVVAVLGGLSQQGDAEKFLSDATLYMEYFSLITIAWQWLKQGVVSAAAIENSMGGEKLFHESKLHTLRYFFHYELPKTQGLKSRLLETTYLTLPLEQELLM